MKDFSRKKSFLNILVVFVLIAAMALSTAGCGSSDSGAAATPAVTADSSVIGQGELSFTLEVVGADGETKTFSIKTDAETVGEALVNEGLIAGETSEYGLYVKTVDGETVDYNKDGHYWAFYINGEYASTGVDSTAVEDGAVYAFKVE